MFRVDAGSGVPIYRQLVQQVRRDVMLGWLRPGDQLPSVKEVVTALSVSLLNAGPHNVTTSNAAAYALYLQGRSIMRSPNLADYERAIQILERASVMDPGFAPTWATLSRARLGKYFDYHIGSLEQVRKDVSHDAERAIELDPDSPDGHLMKARIYMDLDWNWVGAEREMQRALDLSLIHI